MDRCKTYKGNQKIIFSLCDYRGVLGITVPQCCYNNPSNRLTVSAVELSDKYQKVHREKVQTADQDRCGTCQDKVKTHLLSAVHP